jgi:hypothetical protein
MNKKSLATATSIAPLIRTIREQKVLLDSDLARIYGVTTKRFNERVRRNAKRFPSDFCGSGKLEVAGISRMLLPRKVR